MKDNLKEILALLDDEDGPWERGYTTNTGKEVVFRWSHKVENVHVQMKGKAP